MMSYRIELHIKVQEFKKFCLTVLVACHSSLLVSCTGKPRLDTGAVPQVLHGGLSENYLP